MPVYEYQCLSCKKAFDRLQRISDSPLRVCPQCGGELVKKMSVPIVQTKSKSHVVSRLLPEFSGDRLMIDGSALPDYPRRGYAFGVKRENEEK